jgi:hypothetical protein
MSCSDAFILPGQLVVHYRGNNSLPCGNNSRQEVTHLDSVISLGVEEIQTISLFINVVGVPISSACTPSEGVKKLTCEHYASGSTAPTTRKSSCA